MKKILLALTVISSVYADNLYTCNMNKPAIANESDFQLFQLECTKNNDKNNKVTATIMNVDYTKYDIVVGNATKGGKGLLPLTQFSSQMSYNHVKGGINGGFFNMLSDPRYIDDICPTKSTNDYGLSDSYVKSQGKVMGYNCKARPGIVLPEKGVKPKLLDPFDVEPLTANEFNNIISAGPILANNGKIVENVDNTLYPWLNIRAARSAVGFDNSNYITFVTVDQQYIGGQRVLNQGMTIDEFSHFLIENIKLTNALNLDGGGSTTMCYNDFCGKTANTPSDNGKARDIRSGIFVTRN